MMNFILSRESKSFVDIDSDIHTVEQTHMVWDVEVLAGKSQAVPTHLVDQVFSDYHYLLTAVLYPGIGKEPST